MFEVRKKRESLGRDKGPIVACIGDDNSFERKSPFHMFSKAGSHVENVDWSADLKKVDEKEQKNKGKRTYVISKISPENKYSGDLMNCTGITAVGWDKRRNRNISFLTHQDPSHFLRESKEIFSQDLKESLLELKKLSKRKSIDVVIFGGHHDHQVGSVVIQGQSRTDDYVESVKTIGNIVSKSIGIDPTIVVGPAALQTGQYTDVFFDTKRRKLFIGRNTGRRTDSGAVTFKASEIDKVSKEWVK